MKRGWCIGLLLGVNEIVEDVKKRGGESGDCLGDDASGWGRRRMGWERGWGRGGSSRMRMLCRFWWYWTLESAVGVSEEGVC